MRVLCGSRVPRPGSPLKCPCFGYPFSTSILDGILSENGAQNEAKIALKIALESVFVRCPPSASFSHRSGLLSECKYSLMEHQKPLKTLGFLSFFVLSASYISVPKSIQDRSKNQSKIYPKSIKNRPKTDPKSIPKSLSLWTSIFKGFGLRFGLHLGSQIRPEIDQRRPPEALGGHLGARTSPREPLRSQRRPPRPPWASILEPKTSPRELQSSLPRPMQLGSYTAMLLYS